MSFSEAAMKNVTIILKGMIKITQNSNAICRDNGIMGFLETSAGSTTLACRLSHLPHI